METMQIPAALAVLFGAWVTRFVLKLLPGV